MSTPNLTFVYDRKGQASKTKAAVVELRISHNKVRKYISTGVFLLPKQWKNGTVVGRDDWKELNDQLRIYHKKCSEIINQMMDDGCLDLNAVPRLLHEKIMQQETFVEYMKENARVMYTKMSDGTKEHYLLFFRFIDKWKGIIYFSDITERNIMKMDDELSSRGLKECSRWSYHKILKTFILRAQNDGLVKSNPYRNLDIRKGNESGLKRFLTPEEFHRFESCEIDDKCLERVRDVFVFQTYTAMGYQDLADFDYKQCTTLNGHVIYKSKRGKTGQDFTVVLLEPALRIIKKYKGKLPIISNVKYNLYLKAAVKYAKINKCVTTHWARHTGATLLLNEGKVPIHIVQHILGHSSIRETERTYAKLLDESIVESMSNYMAEEKVRVVKL